MACDPDPIHGLVHRSRLRAWKPARARGIAVCRCTTAPPISPFDADPSADCRPPPWCSAMRSYGALSWTVGVGVGRHLDQLAHRQAPLGRRFAQPIPRRIRCLERLSGFRLRPAGTHEAVEPGVPFVDSSLTACTDGCEQELRTPLHHIGARVGARGRPCVCRPDRSAVSRGSAEGGRGPGEGPMVTRRKAGEDR
jgi:hypothetical protein